eukprot:423362-Lingulodinium_polyedra.AAC.1
MLCPNAPGRPIIRAKRRRASSALNAPHDSMRRSVDIVDKLRDRSMGSRTMIRRIKVGCARPR